MILPNDNSTFELFVTDNLGSISTQCNLSTLWETLYYVWEANFLALYSAF